MIQPQQLDKQPPTAFKYIRGALAGLAATVPMTFAMEMMYRNLPREEKAPLPPRELTMKAAEAAGVKQTLLQQERFSLTLLLHFGYGAACGLLYAASFNQLRLPHPLKNRSLGPTKGILFGVGVWTCSYMGWIPAIRMMRPANQHPARRSAVMIGAHIVWGVTTDFLMSKMTPHTLSAFRGSNERGTTENYLGEIENSDELSDSRAAEI